MIRVMCESLTKMANFEVPRDFEHPHSALDETSSFLKRQRYDEICKFVDQIKENLFQKDNCYYQKLVVLGFGGVKSGCEPHDS